MTKTLIMKDLKDKCGRKYSKDELISLLTDKQVYGELSTNTLSNTINLENVSHMFQNFRFEGNDLYADLIIIQATPTGKLLSEIIKHINLETSLRVIGNVDENMNVKNVGVIAIDLMTQISHKVV